MRGGPEWISPFARANPPPLFLPGRDSKPTLALDEMGQHSILMFTISCSAPLSSLHLRVPTDCPIDLCSAENRAQREAQYVEHDAHAAPVRAKRSHLEDESDPSAEKSKRETSSSSS